MAQLCVGAAGLVFLSGVAAARPDLYTNGPIVTGVGAGAGGANLSVLQTVSQGCSFYGFTCQGTPVFNRLADDVTVPAAGWTVASVAFYQFQSGSTTSASTFTSLNLRIWSGRPGDLGSTVVFGDTTTNLLASSVWTGCYRASESSPLNSSRPVYAIEAAINPPLHLDQGTYWLDWQASGTLNSGPFTVPVTILGERGAPGANARGYLASTGFWQNADDAGNNQTQEMAFVVRGTVGGGTTPPCYPNCDGSTTPPALNVQDFSCFLNRFAAADSYANCDLSTTPPILNVQDFACFLNKFASGCSAP